VWGSTYLAIRYAVDEIPPLLTGAVREQRALRRRRPMVRASAISTRGIVGELKRLIKNPGHIYRTAI